MHNASLGIHTFSFFQPLTEEDFSSLGGDIIDQVRLGRLKPRKIKDKGKPSHITVREYTYRANTGIRWRMISINVSYHLTTYGVAVVITPKVLLNKNYIEAAKEDDIKMVEDIFNEEAKQISPILSKFGLCPVNRADCCLNIDVDKINMPCSAEQYIQLFQRGDIPNHFEEWKEYNSISHRKKAPGNNLYLVCGSVKINFYWKLDELYRNWELDRLTSDLMVGPDLNDARHLIRLEIQCLYPKLHSLSKNLRHMSKYNEAFNELTLDEFGPYARKVAPVLTIPADVILTDDITSSIIKKYYYKVVRKGDYFTLDCARWIVEQYGFRREKESRLLDTLEFVNESRGIAKAKAKLSGTEQKEFKRSLKDLDAIYVNPVTIPRKWGITHIPNLLRAYYDSEYEDVLVVGNEGHTHEYMTRYLAGEA